MRFCENNIICTSILKTRSGAACSASDGYERSPGGLRRFLSIIETVKIKALVMRRSCMSYFCGCILHGLHAANAPFVFWRALGLSAPPRTRINNAATGLAEASAGLCRRWPPLQAPWRCAGAVRRFARQARAVSDLFFRCARRRACAAESLCLPVCGGRMVPCAFWFAPPCARAAAGAEALRVPVRVRAGGLLR